MSPGWALVTLALVPLVVWLVAVTAAAVRRWLRRRGDEATRRLRLARLLRRGEVVVVPTSDVDLSEAAVLEVAAGAGMRLVGYERPDTLLRRRSGVFVRIGGPVDAVIRGPLGGGGPATPAGYGGRVPTPR